MSEVGSEPTVVAVGISALISDVHLLTSSTHKSSFTVK